MVLAKKLVRVAAVCALTLSGVGLTTAASARTTVRPAVDESQGCYYRVDQDNISLHAAPKAGSADIAPADYNDFVASVPLDEDSAGWEYVIDYGNVGEYGNDYLSFYFYSGWIGKQYMVFEGCAGPKYDNGPNRGAAEHHLASKAGALQQLLARMGSPYGHGGPSVRPAVDESQGCYYRVDQDNINLYSSDGDGKVIATTEYDDIVVSAPLDETSAGWEFVMDVGNASTQLLYEFPAVGWIAKQFMVFEGCTGPKYDD